MSSADDLKAEEGKVEDVNGQEVAVYKDKDGKVTKLSAVCTHQNCIVEWNKGDKTWDCPCHGSKFNPQGKVLNGPAAKDLPKIQE